MPLIAKPTMACRSHGDGYHGGAGHVVRRACAACWRPHRMRSAVRAYARDPTDLGRAGNDAGPDRRGRARRAGLEVSGYLFTPTGGRGRRTVVGRALDAQREWDA